MSYGDISLFALDASRVFGEAVARHLGAALAGHEEREFEDGEHKSRPLANVRGRDVFVVHSLYADGHHSVNDKLCRLLFFLGAVRDASAQRVTAVVPYLCYARKDRKTQPRDPVTTRYVAGLFEAVGIDRIVTLDVHNLAAYQNAFRCHSDHLEARKLFVEYFAARVGSRAVAVVSPDVGGIKRAELFRQALERAAGRPVAAAFMEKQRAKGVVSGETLVGDVTGKTVIIVDDMIGTGNTIGRAARACRERGAAVIYAAASHGLFLGGAGEVVADPVLDAVVVTDSVPPFRLASGLVDKKLVVVEAAALFAQAIRCIHSGASIVDLLQA